MKRLISLMLAVLLVASLATAVFAEDKAAFEYKNVPTTGELKFTANGEKLQVSYESAVVGKEYLILLVDGSALPTASSQILYIDQQTAEGTTVTFTIYPTMAESKDTLTVFLTSNADSFTTKSATLSAEMNYVLGDVNGENGITSADASLILQYLIGKYTLDDTAKLAADVNGENGVTSADASLILQYLIGKYTIGE